MTNTITKSENNAVDFLYNHAEFKRTTEALATRVGEAAEAIKEKMLALGIKKLRIPNVGTLKIMWYDTQIHGAGWNIFGWEKENEWVNDLLDGEIGGTIQHNAFGPCYQRGNRRNYLDFANNFKAICEELKAKEARMIQNNNNAVESLS